MATISSNAAIFAPDAMKRSWSERLLYGCLLVCLASLPFELTRGLALPGITFTNVECLVMVTLALWAVSLVRERRLPLVSRAFLLMSALFLLILLLSAGLAGNFRVSALKEVLRQIQGWLVALCVAEQVKVRGFTALRHFVLALLGGATLSAIAGLAEMTEAPVVLQLLQPFKTSLSLMGGQLRLSGTFGYTNIAAMYFEAMLPLACVAALAGGRGWWSRLAGASACVLYVATLLTYSRAALVSCLLLLLALPLVVAWRYGRGRLTWWSAVLSVTIAASTLLLLGLSPTFRLRLLDTEVASWYRAQYRPASIVHMAPGEVESVNVEMTNTGLLPWYPNGLSPFRLAYHWLDPTTNKIVLFEGRRTELPHAVAPGTSLAVLATVQAPQQLGHYRLAWDLVHENTGNGWFSQTGTPPATFDVDVSGPPARNAVPDAVAKPDQPQRLEVAPPPPSRRVLWRIALQLWRERPILGLGLDVYRHRYGTLLGSQPWDDRVHTNNLYLEVLTGGGLLGFLAFLGLLGLVLRSGSITLFRAAPRPTAHMLDTERGTDLLWWAMLGVILSLLAFLIHGMLDVFLAWTATYMLFWILLGLVVGLTMVAATLPHSSSHLPER